MMSEPYMSYWLKKLVSIPDYDSLIKKLEKRLQFIVTARLQGKKLSDIAKELGVTSERIRQLEWHAYRVAKKLDEIKRLEVSK